MFRTEAGHSRDLPTFHNFPRDHVGGIETAPRPERQLIDAIDLDRVADIECFRNLVEIAIAEGSGGGEIGGTGRSCIGQRLSPSVAGLELDTRGETAPHLDNPGVVVGRSGVGEYERATARNGGIDHKEVRGIACTGETRHARGIDRDRVGQGSRLPSIRLVAVV